MADDARIDEVVPQLREAFRDLLMQTLQVPGTAAFQTADLLCAAMVHNLASLRVSFPAARRVDPEAIARDWHEGATWQAICRRHGISKRTAYNHHPNQKMRGRG